MNTDVALDDVRPAITSGTGEGAVATAADRGALLRARLLSVLSSPTARRVVLTLADQGVVSAHSLVNQQPWVSGIEASRVNGQTTWQVSVTDGVVRYTLVTRTAGGATNVTYEGIRCEGRGHR